MKMYFFAGLILLHFSIFARADDSVMRSDAPVPPEAQLIRKIIFKKIDFDNNTLGEMVIKLNAMVRDELKDQAAPTVVLNLKGLSESEVTKTLNRKVVHWSPMRTVPFYETLLYVAQLTNCNVERKGLDMVLTPFPPYVERVFDVDTMIHPHRSSGGQ